MHGVLKYIKDDRHFLVYFLHIFVNLHTKDLMVLLIIQFKVSCFGSLFILEINLLSAVFIHTV